MQCIIDQDESMLEQLGVAPACSLALKEASTFVTVVERYVQSELQLRNKL